MQIKYSIITINLNNSTGLEKSIISVRNQTCPYFEYIVIDGGSTDNSIQIIKKYSRSITYWVSEPDNGIFHAMNKGIKVATGEYCLFLNSGDWFHNEKVLENVLAISPTADIVAGDVYFFDTIKNQIQWHVPSPDQLTAKTLFLGTLPHQATFIRRGLFNTIGLYNEQLKVVSDWLFFLEALLVYHCTYHHYNDTIAYFNMDGISCNPNTESLSRREQLNILRQKYPLFLPDYEYLDRLQTQNGQWIESREYRVYKFFERMGIIQVGVFCRKVKRTILRNILRIISK